MFLKVSMCSEHLRSEGRAFQILGPIDTIDELCLCAVLDLITGNL